MLEKIDVEFVGEKKFKISRTPRKLVYNFMAEYNYKRKKYGKKYVDKYIVWQGIFNGCEVRRVNNFFYVIKNNWNIIEAKFTKEVQNV